MKHTTNLLKLGAFLVALSLSINLHAGAGGNGGGGGKPGGGDGGGETTVACVTFDDLTGDTVRSDGNRSYCDDQNNITVSFSQDGHLSLDTAENSKKPGRSLYVDFGEPVVVLDGNGVPHVFQTTHDLDAQGIGHDANLHVGAFQDNFNMLTMLPGAAGARTDVNLTFNLFLHFPGKNNNAVIFVKLAPEILDNDRQCEVSDAVRVTCTDVDGSGNPSEWYVETQDPDNLACVSQDPFGHTETELSIGLRNLSFGFVVTR